LTYEKSSRLKFSVRQRGRWAREDVKGASSIEGAGWS